MNESKNWLGGNYFDRSKNHSGKGPKGYTRSDQRIHEEACERLTHHPAIDASEIEVQVSEGVISLLGLVEDRMTKKRSERILENIIGVRDIQNNLTLRKGFDGVTLGLHRGEDTRIKS